MSSESSLAKLFNVMKEYERVAPEHIKKVHRMQRRVSFVERQLERNERSCRSAREWLKKPFEERGYGIPECLEAKAGIESSLKSAKRKLKDAFEESEKICMCSICETSRRTGYHLTDPCKYNT